MVAEVKVNYEATHDLRVCTKLQFAPNYFPVGVVNFDVFNIWTMEDTRFSSWNWFQHKSEFWVGNERNLMKSLS